MGSCRPGTGSGARSTCVPQHFDFGRGTMSARYGVRRSDVIALAVSLLVVLLATAYAAPLPPAAQLVNDALAKEAQGTASPRESVLQTALERAPDYAPARWHLGFVKYNETW